MFIRVVALRYQHYGVPQLPQHSQSPCLWELWHFFIKTTECHNSHKHSQSSCLWHSVIHTRVPQLANIVRVHVCGISLSTPRSATTPTNIVRVHVCGTSLSTPWSATTPKNSQSPCLWELWHFFINTTECHNSHNIVSPCLWELWHFFINTMECHNSQT